MRTVCGLHRGSLEGESPRWPHPAVVLAGGWSLLYGLLGLWWTMGGGGFPFGLEADPDAGLSALAGVSQSDGAPIIAVLGFTGAAVAILMAQGGRPLRRALLAFAWAAAILLAIVIPDPRWLVVLAYTPVVLLGGLVGWHPARGLLDVITWPLVNQLACIAGGAAWAATALVFARWTRGACQTCGRSDREADVPMWARTPWSTVFVAVAVTVPVIYASTRWAWALDIPLGIDERLLRQIRVEGPPIAPAGLGTMALVGAALTVGLIQPWGERFPRWLPVVGGSSVPVRLAVVPALFIAVLVTATGLVFVRWTIADIDGLTNPTGWGANGPGLLWPLWGGALGAAAIAYHYRRRGRCSACGRGGVAGTGQARQAIRA